MVVVVIIVVVFYIFVIITYFIQDKLIPRTFASITHPASVKAFTCVARTVTLIINSAALCFTDILLIYLDISITLPGNFLFSQIYTYVSNKLTYYHRQRSRAALL